MRSPGASNEVPARGTVEALESSEEGRAAHITSPPGQTWQTIWAGLPSSACACPGPLLCRASLTVLSLPQQGPLSNILTSSGYGSQAVTARSVYRRGSGKGCTAELRSAWLSQDEEQPRVSVSLSVPVWTARRAS